MKMINSFHSYHYHLIFIPVAGSNNILVLLRPTFSFGNGKKQSIRVDLIIIAPCPQTPLSTDTPVCGHPCARTGVSADMSGFLETALSSSPPLSPHLLFSSESSPPGLYSSLPLNPHLLSSSPPLLLSSPSPPSPSPPPPLLPSSPPPLLPSSPPPLLLCSSAPLLLSSSPLLVN